MLQPGAIMQSGRVLTIFALSPKLAGVVADKLGAADEATRARVLSNLHNVARNPPIGMRYCSLSGLQCEQRRLTGCPPQGSSPTDTQTRLPLRRKI